MKRDREWVDVMLCVNDPDHGMPTGHVCRVDIQDDPADALSQIELEGDQLEERDNPVYRIERDPAAGRPGALRVGRRVFAIGGHRTHVGNWCWDAVSMRRCEARRLIAHLLARGFEIIAGPVETDLLPKEVWHDA